MKNSFGCTLIVLLASAWMPSANGVDPSNNAALQYWSALASFPNDSRSTQWEVASRHALTAPVADAEFLFTESGIAYFASWALDDLRQGASMPFCEWGILIGGPTAPAHHMQRSNTALGLLLLSARLKHSKEDWSSALDDLRDAWTFSRHVAAPTASFIHYYNVENSLAPLTAAWLPHLDETSVEKLRSDLRELPEFPKPSEWVLAHKSMCMPWFAESVDLNGVQWIIEELRANERDSLELNSKSKGELAALLDETGGLFDEAADVSSLPMDEFKSALIMLMERIDSNVVARLLTLGELDLGRERDAESKLRTTMAMISAAIAWELEGREGFDRVIDPFGAGAFDYEAAAQGYTLTSRMVVDGAPFSMTFGQGAMPDSNGESKLLIYDSDGNPTDDIRSALKMAQREHKRVLLQWGFNGCIPCYALHQTLEKNKSLSELLDRSYIRVAVDVTRDDSEDLISKYKVELPGVPHLTILGESGEVLANVKPAEQLSVSRVLDTGLLQDFLAKWAGVEDQVKR